MQSISVCKFWGITHTIVPNIYSSSDQKVASHFMLLVGDAAYSKCHKYSREFHCRIIFQKCLPAPEPHKFEVSRYPCRQMCYEIAAACGKERSHYQELNSCAFYPSELSSNTSCYHPTVVCPELSRPRYGHLSYTSRTIGGMAKFSCQYVFQLVGNRQLTCQVGIGFYQFLSLIT